MGEIIKNKMGVPMEYEIEGENIVFRTDCVSCRQPKELRVPATQFYEWRQGKKIQDALPQLTASERELLLSGICGECWSEMFKSSP